MALTYPGMEAVKIAAGDIKEKTKSPRLLSFSYQDLLLNDEEWFSLLGKRAGKIKYRSDAEKIIRWHKCASFVNKIPDTHSVYKLFGFSEIVDADLVKARSNEVVVDLNYTLPESLGQFDLVIDNVSQHCFNIGVAIKSIASCVKPFGWVLHALPMTMLNQGYFCISPCALQDFYKSRGFKVIKHEAYHFDRLGLHTKFDIIPSGRMEVPRDNCFQIFLAQQLEYINPPGWPTQAKFIKHPNSTI
jgi:hypothetical protein